MKIYELLLINSAAWLVVESSSSRYTDEVDV